MCAKRKVQVAYLLVEFHTRQMHAITLLVTIRRRGRGESKRLTGQCSFGREPLRTGSRSSLSLSLFHVFKQMSTETKKMIERSVQDDYLYVADERVRARISRQVRWWFQRVYRTSDLTLDFFSFDLRVIGQCSCYHFTDEILLFEGRHVMRAFMVDVIANKLWRKREF